MRCSAMVQGFPLRLIVLLMATQYILPLHKRTRLDHIEMPCHLRSRAAANLLSRGRQALPSALMWHARVYKPWE